MAYRDEREKCPRCHAELVDAGSVRGCVGCGGQWVPAEILQDMTSRSTGVSGTGCGSTKGELMMVLLASCEFET